MYEGDAHSANGDAEDPRIIDVEFVEHERQDTTGSNEKPPNYNPLALPRGAPSQKGQARVVTVTNQKGGVGKTTSVINIAAQLGLRGHRVLVIDADAQGNCATGLGVDKRLVTATTRDLILQPERAIEARHQTAVDGVHLIVGDRSLVSLDQELLRQLGRERRLSDAITPLSPHYDLIIIDTPPSLGIVTVNALVASHGLIVPVQTEYFALEGLAMLAGTVREVRNLFTASLGVDGILLTMHNERTLLNVQVANELRDTYGPLIVEPAVRRNIRLAEAPAHGVPIHLHDPSSHGGSDYLSVTLELERRWGLAPR
ncbi:MAG TPA: ParA family protein [Candidatus Thalassarchaeaceae archaeon]|nr:ParA family protein [Candidatus Thalassarchaeaceae archaeon]